MSLGSKPVTTYLMEIALPRNLSFLKQARQPMNRSVRHWNFLAKKFLTPRSAPHKCHLHLAANTYFPLSSGSRNKPAGIKILFLPHDRTATAALYRPNLHPGILLLYCRQKTHRTQHLHVKTPYLLIEKDGKWRNASSNLLEMAPHLIDAVITAAYATQV